MPDQTLAVRLYSAATPLMQQFLDSGVLVKALDVEPLLQRGYYLCQPTGGDGFGYDAGVLWMVAVGG